MLISEAFELYRLDFIVFKNQSKKTEENHYVCMRALISFTGDIEIERVNFSSVRDWKIHLDKSRSPATVRNYIIRLRVVLAYLRNKGMNVLNADTIPVPKRVEKAPQYLTSAEVATLIDSTLRVKNKAIISLLYASGIRISELCNMDRGDIKEDCFTVIGKGGKPRLCFVDERTKTLLTQYLDGRQDNNIALFLTDAGRRITPGTIQETFKSVRKKSGIEAHPHTLRHSFATNLLKNNANMRYVQEFLGHQSLQTTQMYTHVVNEDLRAVYNAKHTI